MDPRPRCWYGRDCYRTNPDHLEKFRHDLSPLTQRGTPLEPQPTKRYNLRKRTSNSTLAKVCGYQKARKKQNTYSSPATSANSDSDNTDEYVDSFSEESKPVKAYGVTASRRNSRAAATPESEEISGNELEECRNEANAFTPSDSRSRTSDSDSEIEAERTSRKPRSRLRKHQGLKSGRKLKKRSGEDNTKNAQTGLEEATETSGLATTGELKDHGENRSTLQSLTVKKLRGRLRELGLKVTGRKDELIARVEAAISGQDNPSAALPQEHSRSQTTKSELCLGEELPNKTLTTQASEKNTETALSMAQSAGESGDPTLSEEDESDTQNIADCLARRKGDRSQTHALVTPTSKATSPSSNCKDILEEFLGLTSTSTSKESTQTALQRVQSEQEQSKSELNTQAASLFKEIETSNSSSESDLDGLFEFFEDIAVQKEAKRSSLPASDQEETKCQHETALLDSSHPLFKPISLQESAKQNSASGKEFCSPTVNLTPTVSTATQHSSVDSIPTPPLDSSSEISLSNTSTTLEISNSVGKQNLSALPTQPLPDDIDPIEKATALPTQPLPDDIDSVEEATALSDMPTQILSEESQDNIANAPTLVLSSSL